MPTASQLFSCSAASTPAPVSSETSRSADRPPITTATRRPANRCGFDMSVLSDDLDLELERDAMDPLDLGAHPLDQPEQLGGGGAAGVDQPVGVDRGAHGIPFAPALASRDLDQPAGEVARRVLERRAVARDLP